MNDIIKSIEVYIGNIVFTTPRGLRMAYYRPKHYLNKNLFFKINLFQYSGKNSEIDYQITKLNNLLIKEAVKKYYGDKSLLDKYPELFNYEIYISNSDIPYLDKYTIIADMTN